MVNLQAKGRQEAERKAMIRQSHLRSNGYTIFRFDFARRYTRKDLSVGDACRALMEFSGYRLSFWRCPVRGLAVQIQTRPATTYLHDKGDSWKVLIFSADPDERVAKHALVLDAILAGMDGYRALPNALFQEQTAIVRSLLTAPASFPAEEWMAYKAKLLPWLAPLIDTHAADLRSNLL